MHNTARLRQILIDQVGTSVGTYPWENGSVTPAIAVGNPPNNIKVGGIEIILPLLPRIISSVRTSFDVRTLEEYTIHIYQHDESSAGYEQFYLLVTNLFGAFFNMTGYDIPKSSIPDSRLGYCMKLRIDNCYEVTDITSPLTDGWLHQ